MKEVCGGCEETKLSFVRKLQLFFVSLTSVAYKQYILSIIIIFESGSTFQNLGNFLTINSGLRELMFTHEGDKRSVYLFSIVYWFSCNYFNSILRKDVEHVEVC